jgi:hypothetical protein
MRTGSPGHLKTFDSIGFQRYFLTFCTRDREQVFVSREPVDLVRAQILRAAHSAAASTIASSFADNSGNDTDMSTCCEPMKTPSALPNTPRESCPRWPGAFAARL